MNELTRIAMENGELFTRLLQNMNRSSQELLNTIARQEERIEKLEQRLSMLEAKGVQLDPANMADEQLQLLGEQMYERGSLKETISTAIDYHLENELEGMVKEKISDYIDNVDIEVECSAYLKDRN